MSEAQPNGRFQLDPPTKWLAGMLTAAAAVVGLWMALGFPTPATKDELARATAETRMEIAANAKADAEFRLSYFNQRRDQLYETRAKYQRENQPVPPWLRQEITRVCEKITRTKHRLGLAATCAE